MTSVTLSRGVIVAVVSQRSLASLEAAGLGAAMLIVFIKAVGDFGVPSILGGEFQVLPTLIYYQIHGFFNLNAASAIAAVNVLLTLVALGLDSLAARVREARAAVEAKKAEITSAGDDGDAGQTES